VVEEIDECVGKFTLAVTFKNVEIISPGLLRVFMTLILIWIKGFFGMSWLVCLVGGPCLSALGVILTLIGSPVRDQEKLVHVQLWWSFLTSFLIRA
jgi:hypothetical protein